MSRAETNRVVVEEIRLALSKLPADEDPKNPKPREPCMFGSIESEVLLSLTRDGAAKWLTRIGYNYYRTSFSRFEVVPGWYVTSLVVLHDIFLTLSHQWPTPPD
jgi:hypothetical protein